MTTCSWWRHQMETFSVLLTLWAANSPVTSTPLISWFMGPTWGPSGADRTQVGPMLAPWALLSGSMPHSPCLLSVDDVTIDFIMQFVARQFWHGNVKIGNQIPRKSILSMIIFMVGGVRTEVIFKCPEWKRHMYEISSIWKQFVRK